jgi:hypothetical protein
MTPLVHWKTPKLDTSMIAVESWNRSNKPDAKDFLVFKADACWVCTKERFQTSLDAQGLSHLIKEDHVVTNLQLVINQRAQSCKILQNVMQQPICKAIVINHLRDKDTVKIWKRICEAMGNSMATQFTSQSISTHLTLTRPTSTAGWNSSQQSCPLDYFARKCNDVSMDSCSSGQLVQFPHASTAGLPNLAQVLTLHETVKRVAGVTTSTTFTDHVAALMQQAQVHDACRGNRQTSPRQPQCSANFTPS